MTLASIIPRLIAGICTIGLSALAAAAPPLYRITDIGVLPGDERSEAIALNNQGQVLAYSLRFTSSGSQGHLFVWSAGTGAVVIGPKERQPYSNGISINDQGMVIANTDGAQARWWTADKGWHDIDPLPGDSYLLLSDLNDKGQAVGYTRDLNTTHWPVSWSRTEGVKRLPYPGYDAFAVNGKGQMALYHFLGFKNSRGARLELDGSVTEMGLLPTETKRGMVNPRKINSQGLVVGSATDGQAGSEEHAFLWKPSKGMSDLGSLPPYRFSYAYGINAKATVVGRLGRQGFAENPHMFVWTQGTGMLDANDLVDPTDPLYGLITLSDGIDINEAGQVAGIARFADGSDHAVLLTPVP